MTVVVYQSAKRAKKLHTIAVIDPTHTSTITILLALGCYKQNNLSHLKMSLSLHSIHLTSHLCLERLQVREMHRDYLFPVVVNAVFQ